jgi:hypothetical protein
LEGGEVQIPATFTFGRNNRISLMVYIKIIDIKKVRAKENMIKRSLRFFLGLVLPKANPDFEKVIELVSHWLLEFNDKHSLPTREIGLSPKGDVLLKMPYKDNYGYWIDNNLTLEDFLTHFKNEEITRDYFEKKWMSFH